MSTELLRAMAQAPVEQRRLIQKQLVENAERTSTAQSWYFVAVGHTLLDEHEAAIPLLTGLLQQDPAWEEARFLLGRSYLAAVHPERAAETFAELRRTGSPRVRALVEAEVATLRQVVAEAASLGRALSRRANELVQIVATPSRPAVRGSALDAYERLLVDSQDSLGVLVAYAFALAVAGKRESAQAKLDQLLRAAPGDFDVRWNAAEISRMIGKLDRAKEHYTRAFELARNDGERAQVRERYATLAQERAVLFGDFEAIAPLGAGGMGSVWLVESKQTKERMALKRVREPDERLRRALIDELQVQLELPPHPHLVKLLGLRTEGDELGILSELVVGETLADWSARPNRGAASIVDMLLQLAFGIEALHHAGFAHLDIKPANALVNREGIVKLADFGLAAGLSEIVGDALNGGERSARRIPIGTPQYHSPEQAARSPETYRPSDVWSFAVSALHVVAGEVTWMSGTAGPDVLEALEGSIDPPFATILARCFSASPKDRPTMSAVVDELCAYQRTIATHVRPKPPLPLPQHEAQVRGELADQEKRRLEDDRADYHDPSWWLDRLGAHELRDDLAKRAMTNFVGGRGQQTLYLEAFRSAARVAESRAPALLAGIFADSARLHHRLGDPSGAIDACRAAERAGAAHAHDAEARYHAGRAARLRGLIHLASEDRAAAFDAFQAAIAALGALDPNDPRHATELGLALVMQAQLFHVAGHLRDALACAHGADAAFARVDRPDAVDYRRRAQEMIRRWQ